MYIDIRVLLTRCSCAVRTTARTIAAPFLSATSLWGKGRPGEAGEKGRAGAADPMAGRGPEARPAAARGPGLAGLRRGTGPKAPVVRGVAGPLCGAGRMGQAVSSENRRLRDEQNGIHHKDTKSTKKSRKQGESRSQWGAIPGPSAFALTFAFLCALCVFVVNPHSAFFSRSPIGSDSPNSSLCSSPSSSTTSSTARMRCAGALLPRRAACTAVR